MTWYEYDWTQEGAPFPIDHRPAVILILGIEMWLSDLFGPQNADLWFTPSEEDIDKWIHPRQG